MKMEPLNLSDQIQIGISLRSNRLWRERRICFKKELSKNQIPIDDFKGVSLEINRALRLLHH